MDAGESLFELLAVMASPRAQEIIAVHETLGLFCAASRRALRGDEVEGGAERRRRGAVGVA
jgi:hypothetical protein